MSLLTTQSAFMAAILDENAPANDGAGINVYRNNYRGALMAAMAESYPRTRDWVGTAAFNRAAAHHVLTHPSSHWSLDLVGEGFADTCAQLFAQDGDVAELARVEWAMQTAFTAADVPVFTADDFARATAAFGDADWEGLRLTLHPSVAIVPVTYNVPEIWNRLNEGPADDNTAVPMHRPAACAVYRADAHIAFMLVGEEEAACLSLVQSGADFATICATHATVRDSESGAAESAAAEVGQMLARWLATGWLAV